MAVHHTKAVEQETLDLSELKKHLSYEFPGLSAVERHRFVMVADLAKLIFTSEKSSTIRYTKGVVEYPSAQELPLFVVGDHREQVQPTCVGALQIGAVRYKTLAELDEHDARKDGFATKAELVDALRRFYGDIPAHDILSVFEFTLSPSEEADTIACSLRDFPSQNGSTSLGQTSRLKNQSRGLVAV
ncbi:MAG: ASCH domain-containing protein [Allorhizobium sp.]